MEFITNSKQISSTDMSIKDLLSRVQQGEYVLPEIQRRYVWQKKQIREFLDSLYRQYPSGSILVWENRDPDIQRRNLSINLNHQVALPSNYLILDGQQRLTSLLALYTGDLIHKNGKDERIEILFNLSHPEEYVDNVSSEEEDFIGSTLYELPDVFSLEDDPIEVSRKLTFVVSSKRLLSDTKGKWVSVTDIFQKDIEDIVDTEYFLETPKDMLKKYRQRLSQVKKILDYKYRVHILNTAFDYDEVTNIFIRLNSSGVRLKKTDLALSRITSKWPGALKEFETFAGQLQKDSAYQLDLGIISRILTINLTGQCRFDTISKHTQDQWKQAWKASQEPIKLALNFIRSSKVRDNIDMVSPFILLPIIQRYTIRDVLQKSEEDIIKQWLALAHTFGHYSGSSETKLDADLKILRDGFRGLIKNITDKIGRSTIDSDYLKEKTITNPIFTSLYFMVCEQRSQDWLTGTEINRKISGAYKLQYHHIFPKALLKGKYDDKNINEIANYAFISGRGNRKILDTPPSEYLPRIIDNRGEEALIQQFIPTDSTLWKEENYLDFLAARRKLIAQQINIFLGHNN